MKLKTLTDTAIVFSYSDGLADSVFDPRAASTICNEQARLKGWEARLRDTAALSRKQPDGTIITITEAMRKTEVDALIAHYVTGTEAWNVGAKAAAPNPFFIRLAEKRNCTYAEAQSWYQAKLLEDMDVGE